MLHLEGNNAPVDRETDAVPTRVVGAIPPSLTGTFVRNGPNPRSGWSPHLFAGDGMVHAVVLDDGVARSYRNRWVRTDGRTTANTHVVSHAGRLLALEEGGLPHELTMDLDTIGPYDFGGALTTAMTAHPKTCPRTGELLFFGYSLRRPHLTYHRASRDGVLLSSTPVELPCATMIHDFAITATSAIFPDSPVVFDRTGMPPWRWDDTHAARFGVLARDGSGEVQWFETEPCHVSHVMNAHDDGDDIVVTGTRIEHLWRGGSDDMTGDLPRLHRWTLHRATGTVTEARLDDTTTEYPRVADADVGLPHRFGWSTDFVMDAEPDHGELYRYDLLDGASRVTHRFPPGHTCGEPVYADGFVLTFAHDRAAGTSYLAILDADDLAAAPVAEVHLPVRVPAGFHGSWIFAEGVDPAHRRSSPG